MSGLPGRYAGSWQNASEIVHKPNGVSPHPAGIKNMFIVQSSKTTDVYVTSVFPKLSCTCKRFEKDKLCAHILAVGHHTSCIQEVLRNLPKDCLQDFVDTPSTSGKKPGLVQFLSF